MEIIKILFGVIISFSVYKIWIVDPEIEPIIKIVDFVVSITNSFAGVPSEKINRNFINYMRRQPTFTDGKYIDGINIYHTLVKSLIDDYSIPVNVYLPENNEKTKLPVIFYIHGGGWVFPLLPEGNQFPKEGFIFIVVDYRLSPEFKHPIPLEDCFSVLNWIVNESNIEDMDLNRLYVMGDSAGGNLASTLSILNRERKTGIQIARQILIYPAIITRTIGDSKLKHENGYILTGEKMRWYENQYMRTEEDYNNPYVSPLALNDMEGLPPALFVFSTEDYLYSEGIEYMNKLSSSGIKTDELTYKTAHGFLDFTSVGEVAKKDIINYLKKTE
jgi:acetyl esterase